MELWYMVCSNNRFKFEEMYLLLGLITYKFRVEQILC